MKYICIYMHEYIIMYINQSVCVCVYVCVCMCACVCVHVYVHKGITYINR